MVGEHGSFKTIELPMQCGRIPPQVLEGKTLQDSTTFLFPTCPGGNTMTCPACAGSE